MARHGRHQAEVLLRETSSNSSNSHVVLHSTRGGHWNGIDVLELSQLNHAVVAPGVEERLRIRISQLQLPDTHGHHELRCKAYVGPRAVVECADGRLDKGRLKEVKLDVSNNAAFAEVDVGVPFPQEPWALRVKFYYRPAAQLFCQEKVGEVVELLPMPASRVELQPGGSVVLEVHRLVPASALDALKAAAARVLAHSVELGVEADHVEDLCAGARELGEDTLRVPAAADALQQAACTSKVAVVQKLLASGVPATTAAVRAAEKVGTPESVKMAQEILEHISVPADQPAKPLLVRALEEGFPLVAERILEEDPDALNALPGNTAQSAEKAYTAEAWTVLAALLSRGDPSPFPARGLLDYALRNGHLKLARACLARTEGVDSMKAAIHTCLDNGRTEIVREALEAQWRANAEAWSGEDSGPPLLKFECGPADEPAECGVCYEPLSKNPGVFLSEYGLRACQHFLCLDCAEHVQDEAADRLRIWRARRDARFPQPSGPFCPLCRAPFVTAVRLADPTLDPRSFFRLACMPSTPEEEATKLRLTEKIALGAFCALLPINAMTFAPRLEKELWPKWCAEAGVVVENGEEGALAEADFLRPGGMLAWISDHLLEMKVEGQRGSPPRLQDKPEKWFRHFDYNGKGILSKPEVLRGIAKAYDVSALACPTTPARRARVVGVQRLHEIVDSVWDESRWRDGVTKDDFLTPSGLADRLLQALLGESDSPRARGIPSASPSASPHPKSLILSVEDALEKARNADLQVREEDDQRAKERAERQRLAAAVMPAPRQAARGRGLEPGRPGAELLLASLLEAAREGHRGHAPTAIRIQCPFCGAVNQARAGAGHRVMCGGCRSVFAVPSAAGAPAVSAAAVRPSRP